MNDFPHLVGEQLPRGPWDVLDVLAVVVRVARVVALERVGPGVGRGDVAHVAHVVDVVDVVGLVDNDDVVDAVLGLGPDAGVGGVVVFLVDVDLHLLFLEGNK